MRMTQAAVYAELILASVCDSYEKTAAPPDAFPRPQGGYLI